MNIHIPLSQDPDTDSGQARAKAAGSSYCLSPLYLKRVLFIGLCCTRSRTLRGKSINVLKQGRHFLGGEAGGGSTDPPRISDTNFSL